MKRILLALAVVCFAATAYAQQPPIYQCIRPDGTVVGTVSDTSGDPSSTCNHDLVDCNLVCAAKLLLTDQGGGMVPVVPPQVPAQRTQPEPGGPAETPAYCQQKYQECTANCRADPKNRTAYDRDACIASCNSWRSGCGTWNKSRDGY